MTSAPELSRKTTHTYPADGRAGRTTTDVTVRIGARVVEVHVEHASIRTIVPVATTIATPTKQTARSLSFYLSKDFLYPPMSRPISLFLSDQTSLWWIVSGGAYFVPQ